MQGFWEVIQEAPDLILLDMAMPQGNGQFVLECLKSNRHSASIPVVVLSGLRDPALCSRAMQLGAAKFLRKPIHFDDLLQEIGRFVDLRPKFPDPEQHRSVAVRPSPETVAGDPTGTPFIRCDLPPRGTP